MRLAIHLALFLCIALPIVALSAFYSESGDRKAFATLPRRVLAFLIGCALLAGVMLVCEEVFAGID